MYLCAGLVTINGVEQMKEHKIEIVVQTCKMAELNEADRELVEAAKRSTKGSYAPYSGFKVGAAVRLRNGLIVIGSNQENAAYRSGLCAERTALFVAGAQFPNEPVVALAIAAKKGRIFTKQATPPCGACRQVIAGVEDRFGKAIRILLYGSDGVVVVNGIDALLPLRFSTF